MAVELVVEAAGVVMVVAAVAVAAALAVVVASCPCLSLGHENARYLSPP